MRIAIGLLLATLLACGCGGGSRCIHNGDSCDPPVPATGPPPTAMPGATLVGGECQCTEAGCRCVPIYEEQQDGAAPDRAAPGGAPR